MNILPNDILFMIAERIRKPKDFANFGMCSRTTAKIIRDKRFRRRRTMYKLYLLELKEEAFWKKVKIKYFKP